MNRSHHGLGLAFAAILLIEASCAPHGLRRGTARTCGPIEGSFVLQTPGNPQVPHFTEDGCWLFITMTGGNEPAQRSLALFRNVGNSFVLHYLAPPHQGAGIGTAMTRDESTIIVTNGANRILFYDVEKLKARDSTALRGTIMGDLPGAGRLMPVLSPNDRFLFVPNEGAASITVIDMQIVGQTGYDSTAVVGYLKTGNEPIAIAFSRDGRHIFTTSASAPASAGWRNECGPPPRAPVGTPPDKPRGAILIFNYEQATTAPNTALPQNIVAAGCAPVRLVTDAESQRIYVTAVGSQELLVFDAERILDPSGNSLVGSVPISPYPTALELVNKGKWAAVGSSNRVNPTAADTLPVWVVDLSKVQRGREAVLGSIRGGAFPRNLTLTPDGRTLVISNSMSRTLQFVDMSVVKLRTPGFISPRN